MRAFNPPSPLPFPSPSVACEPLVLPNHTMPLLDADCKIISRDATSDLDSSAEQVAVFADLTTFCASDNMRDAIALADESGCGFVAIRSLVSIVVLGDRSDPTRCQVIAGVENFFTSERPNVLSLRLRPVNLAMHASPERMVDVELPLSFPDEILHGVEVEATMLWRKDEMAQVLILMEEADNAAQARGQTSEGLVPSPSASERTRSWWVPLAQPLGPITHIIPRDAVVIVERADDDFVRVQLLEPRLVTFGVPGSAEDDATVKDLQASLAAMGSVVEGTTAASSTHAGSTSAASPRNRLSAALAAAAELSA